MDGGSFWGIGMGVAAYGVDVFLGVLMFGYGHCGLQGGHFSQEFDVWIWALRPTGWTSSWEF